MKFDSYHPAINFIFFLSVLVMTFFFRQPVYLMLSFFTAVIVWMDIRRKNGWLLPSVLLLFSLLFSLWYGSYHHFGSTVLYENRIGNAVTWEALFCGLTYGVMTASLILWLFIMHQVMTKDKLTYLFGRISPRLSLFLAILFREAPRVQAQYRKIIQAQSSIGYSGYFGKVGISIRSLSATVSWMLEDFVMTSESMRSRGYTLKGRTAFSVFRFDYRDRLLVLILFTGLTLMLVSFLLGQTKILFTPVIRMTSVTFLSCLFYLVYFLFCLTPVLVHLFSNQDSFSEK